MRGVSRQIRSAVLLAVNERIGIPVPHDVSPGAEHTRGRTFFCRDRFQAFYC
jgi:hypothetical protein